MYDLQLGLEIVTWMESDWGIEECLVVSWTKANWDGHQSVFPPLIQKRGSGEADAIPDTKNYSALSAASSSDFAVTEIIKPSVSIRTTAQLLP